MKWGQREMRWLHGSVGSLLLKGAHYCLFPWLTLRFGERDSQPYSFSVAKEGSKKKFSLAAYLDCLGVEDAAVEALEIVAAETGVLWLGWEPGVLPFTGYKSLFGYPTAAEHYMGR